MGSGRVDYFPQNTEGEESPSLSYDEICDRLCPDYMAMGMTYDEYWNGDPEAVVFFRKTNELKKKQKNHELWLQGKYIYEALGCISPLFHDWIKDPKPMPYPSEPYPLTKDEAEERKHRDDEEHDKKVQATFRALVNKINNSKMKGAQNG